MSSRETVNPPLHCSLPHLRHRVKPEAITRVEMSEVNLNLETVRVTVLCYYPNH